MILIILYVEMRIGQVVCLLLERALIPDAVGVVDGVQVHVHQVVEVLQPSASGWGNMALSAKEQRVGGNQTIPFKGFKGKRN